MEMAIALRSVRVVQSDTNIKTSYFMTRIVDFFLVTNTDLGKRIVDTQELPTYIELNMLDRSFTEAVDHARELIVMGCSDQAVLRLRYYKTKDGMELMFIETATHLNCNKETDGKKTSHQSRNDH